MLLNFKKYFYEAKKKFFVLVCVANVFPISSLCNSSNELFSCDVCVALFLSGLNTLTSKDLSQIETNASKQTHVMRMPTVPTPRLASLVLAEMVIRAMDKLVQVNSKTFIF